MRTNQATQEPMDCCICGKEIEVVGTWVYGCNAEPVVEEGRCCRECDMLVVLPARLARYSEADVAPLGGES